MRKPSSLFPRIYHQAQ